MYDATLGRFISQDPIGFRAGDQNLYRYVRNRVTTSVDPLGTEEWRLDFKGDHGGPHFQLGNERWDAFNLKPLKHKGHTPSPLSSKQLDEIRQCNLWDKALKELKDTTLERAIRERLEEEVVDNMKKRGFRSLNKTIAKEIAEATLRRTPLALLFIALSSKEIMADCEKRGVVYATANQVVPVSVVDELVASGQQEIDRWLQENRYDLWKKQYLNAGFSEEEAVEQAWQQMPSVGDN